MFSHIKAAVLMFFMSILMAIASPAFAKGINADTLTCQNLILPAANPPLNEKTARHLHVGWSIPLIGGTLKQGSTVWGACHDYLKSGGTLESLTGTPVSAAKVPTQAPPAVSVAPMAQPASAPLKLSPAAALPSITTPAFAKPNAPVTGVTAPASVVAAPETKPASAASAATAPLKGAPVVVAAVPSQLAPLTIPQDPQPAAKAEPYQWSGQSAPPVHKNWFVEHLWLWLIPLVLVVVVVLILAGIIVYNNLPDSNDESDDDQEQEERSPHDKAYDRWAAQHPPLHRRNDQPSEGFVEDQEHLSAAGLGDVIPPKDSGTIRYFADGRTQRR
ncbi:MAG: hypothetical protein JWL88_817 [Parcubacteria group bacterium]|nr:hypothetical protein [Parcubacteria group bacterium]